MHAVTVDDTAHDDDGRPLLRWAATDDPPAPGPGEVLLDVAAAGVNRADLLQRAGHYPPPPGASPVLGLEVAGRVAAVGDGVTGWAVGEAACALLDGGGYAERALVRAGQLLPVPDGLSLVEAAALPEACCTAWAALVEVGALRPGETVLVHGGSGGVGTVAVQLAAGRGARVLCTAGSADKAERLRALGAAATIDYRTEDVAARVQELTDGRGADVVLDVLGGGALAANVAALARDGRLVVIGLQAGTRAELDLGALLAKRASIRTTTLRSRAPDAKAALVQEVGARLWDAVAIGRLRPVVDAVLPVQDAAEAHRRLADGDRFGKVVLVVDPALA